MRRTIAVHLGEEQRRIGTLRYNQQGSRMNVAFEYRAVGNEGSIANSSPAASQSASGATDTYPLPTSGLLGGPPFLEVR